MTCPGCKYPVQEDWVVCALCGRRLKSGHGRFNFSKSLAHIKSQPEGSGSSGCLKCAESLAAGLIYCPFCGVACAVKAKFGDSHKAAMFEGLVRQALVGGAWRDVCREQDFNSEEIEAEVKRRRDALKPDTSFP